MTQAATIRVLNASKCRRNFVIDTQVYYEKDGRLRKDVNGRALQPKLTEIALEQGANEVDRDLWNRLVEADKLRAKPYVAGLLKMRVLRVGEITPATLTQDDADAIDPQQVDDLSAFTVDAAKKLIARVEDGQLLRKFVDHDPRPTVRAALRERWAEITPRERIPSDFGAEE
jgi:hypothetical protein